MKNPFKLNSAIASLTSLAIGGAGSAAIDWALEKYNVLPAEWGETAVNAGKAIAGAAVGSMLGGKKGWQPVVKSACDGIATVAVYNIMKENVLPAIDDATPAVTTGLPEGTIGKIELGQRGFRPAGRRIAGLSGADFMAE